MTISRRDDLLQTISDMSKDAYGFRSRQDYTGWSEARLLEEIASLQAAVDRSIAEDRARQAQAETAFEAHIAALMRDHGLSRADAVRWDMQAEKTDAVDYYLWLKDLDGAACARVCRELGLDLAA